MYITIGQDQTSLLNHYLSTQRQPHAVPHALLSFINNTSIVINMIVYFTPKHKQHDVIDNLCHSLISKYATLT